MFWTPISMLFVGHIGYGFTCSLTCHCLCCDFTTSPWTLCLTTNQPLFLCAVLSLRADCSSFPLSALKHCISCEEQDLCRLLHSSKARDITATETTHDETLRPKRHPTIHDVSDETRCPFGILAAADHTKQRVARDTPKRRVFISHTRTDSLMQGGRDRWRACKKNHMQGRRAQKRPN